MVLLGIVFSLIVLVAGVLLTWGFASANLIPLGIGFVLMAFAAIFGMQPGFMNRSR